MSISALIGSFSLNISLFFYCIVYLPQIFHNRTTANLSDLSIWMHGLLFLSYSFDLVYGFASGLPWQYKLVSIVGLLLVSIQHIQLQKLFILQKYYSRFKAGVVLIICSSLLISYIFTKIQNHSLDASTILILGIIARASGLMYCIPQIIKNKVNQSSRAVSLYFIYLNLLLAVLDSISAWCLNWGWPNKIASPVNIAVMLIILWQNKQYGGLFERKQSIG
ncbi:MAG: PQ-loop repeat-containing protein [Legionellaceae bacterium]|nr:PQ-loop repeat-containing protein [Legionellaceae bacterium]